MGKSESNIIVKAEKLRIGLYGGTFNPVHNGHVQVIKEVRIKFNLDKIFIIPSALPPHKESSKVAGAQDRMDMIRLVFSDDSGYTVSDVEIKRPGPSYTIDTVHYYKSVLPEASQLFFILGLDAFFEIDTWKSYKDLFQILPFIVMSRPGMEDFHNAVNEKKFEEYLKAKISKGYRFVKPQSCWEHNIKQTVYICNVTPVNIASTKIRKLIKKKSDIKSFVPASVEDYIKSKGLYL